MTSKEAAHIVDVAFGVPQAVRRVGEDRTYHEGEIKEAKDMALKALEQESCKDCISRQAVLDIIDSDWKYEGMEQYVNNLPSANPQPKTGHWIIIDDCERFIAKCSECGQIEDSRMISKYPYCHCGARMIEP